MEYIKNLQEFGFNTNNSVYIIAEIGINHNGSVDVAKRLIDSVSRTGADAVKFQTYITEKRVSKSSPIYDILKKCELPFEAFAELKEYASKLSLDFFSTPFDIESVDFLQSLHCDLYKIASFDVINHQLLNKIASTHKPVIMSVGMATMDEIKKAYSILELGTDNIAILHCISSYPTNEADAHLADIFKLKYEFDCIIGQSDHTNDIVVPIYAVAAGAQIIEKHYKIDENMECVDGPVSITENQMKKLVSDIRLLEKILGKEEFGVREAEINAIDYRRYSK